MAKQRKKSFLKQLGVRLSKVRRKTIILITTAIFVIVGVGFLIQSFAYSPSFTYYNQKDIRWAQSSYPYKTGTPASQQGDIAMERSGCGPTSMAMVASTLSRTVTPIDIATWYGSRYHTPDGTHRDAYPVFAQDYGLLYNSLGYFTNPTNRLNIQSQLITAKSLVIVHAGPGMFTNAGHILVIRDYNSQTGQYLLADPSHTNNNRWFSETELLQSGNLNTAYGFSVASTKNPAPTGQQPSSSSKNP